MTPQAGAVTGLSGVKWSDWVRQGNQLRIDYEFELPTGTAIEKAKVVLVFDLQTAADEPRPFVTLSVTPPALSQAGPVQVIMSCKPPEPVGRWRKWFNSLNRKRALSTGYLTVSAKPAQNDTNDIHVNPSEGSEKIVQIFQLAQQVFFSIWREGDLILRLTWGNDADFARDYDKLYNDVANSG